MFFETYASVEVIGQSKASLDAESLQASATAVHSVLSNQVQSWYDYNTEIPEHKEYDKECQREERIHFVLHEGNHLNITRIAGNTTRTKQTRVSKQTLT